SHRLKWQVRQTDHPPVLDQSTSMSRLCRAPACRQAMGHSIPIASGLAEWSILRAPQEGTEPRCMRRRSLPSDLEPSYAEQYLVPSRDELYEHERKRAIEITLRGVEVRHILPPGFLSRRTGEERGEEHSDRRPIDPHADVCHGEAPISDYSVTNHY